MTPRPDVRPAPRKPMRPFSITSYPLVEGGWKPCPVEARFVGENGAVAIATCGGEQGHVGPHAGPLRAEWK